MKGLTVAATARAANLSPHTVAALEAGRGTVESLTIVAKALGMLVSHSPAELAAARVGAGLPIADIARRARVSRQSIYTLERSGHGNMRVFTQIARAIGVRLALRPITREHTWSTPPHILDALYATFGGAFDLDPASPPVPTVRCHRWFTKADNGLVQPWQGRVFVNPPYQTLAPWCDKMLGEVAAKRATLLVALIPCSVETRAWKRIVLSGAAIFILEGRLRFGGHASCARFASAVIVWGASARQLAKLSDVLPPHHRVHAAYAEARDAAE